MNTKPNPTYCGTWPERDHSDCPSSVECQAVTLDDLSPEVPTLVLECGCTITTNDPEPFTSYTPCTERHRLIAMLVREPGSMIVIGSVRA